jgi:hypothetical protein
MLTCRSGNVFVAVIFTLSAMANASAQSVKLESQMPFQLYSVVDKQFGDMRVATLSIPKGWRVQSSVNWDFTSGNYPVTLRLRADSPDGKMWFEIFPTIVVSWMSYYYKPVPDGQRMFGTIHVKNPNAEQVMQRFMIQPARGSKPGFQVVGKNPLNPAALAQAFKMQAFPKQVKGAEALSIKVRYNVGGATAQEDFYSWYGGIVDIPYTGPQGTTFEYHRHAFLNHAVGAVDGLLPSVYPIVRTVIASIQADRAWGEHVQRVQQQIMAQFEANMRAGYDRIAAAGALSKQISANNDAMIRSMQATRAAQSRPGAGSSGQYNASDQFSQYIRGTTRLEDPYSGTTERDSYYKHHWTDGQGNYRASNDVGFNPNIGGSPGQTWQQMGVAR